MELFKLMGTIAIENGQAINAMDETTDHAEKSHSKIKSAFKKIGAVAAATFAVDKIVDFGKACIETAAEMEATASQFSQVFGELEASASKNLSEIAKTTGVVENRMKGSYTKIAAFAKTSGMETADALDLADRAMIAIADSAAFYDRSLEETTESLQSFLKGNYENDAALGLSCTETTRNAAAMEQFGVKFNELTEIQKQQTLMKMVEDANELSGAMGQASRESDTWTNQVGNLKQAWKDFQGVLGKPILKLATSAVGGLADMIGGVTEKIGGFIQAMSDSGERTEWFRRTLRKLVGVEFADSIMNSIGGFTEAFSSQFEAIQAIAAKTQEVIQKVFSGIASFLERHSESIGAVISGITSFAGGLGNIVTGIVTGDMNKASEGVKKVGDGIVGVFEGIGKFVGESKAAIKEFLLSEEFRDFTDALPQNQEEANAALKLMWNDFKAWLLNFLGELWEKAKPFLEKSWNGFKTWLNEMWEKLKEDTLRFAKEWGGIIMQGIEDVMNFPKDLMKGLMGDEAYSKYAPLDYDPMRYAKQGATNSADSSSSFAYVPTTNSVQSASGTYSSQNIASEIRSALNNLEMSVKVDVVPDERGIFKVVQNQAKIYSKSTGQGAFA